MQLRRIGKSVGTNRHQLGILRGQCKKLVLRGDQSLMAKIAMILQLEIKAAGLPQPRH